VQAFAQDQDNISLELASGKSEDAATAAISQMLNDAWRHSPGKSGKASGLDMFHRLEAMSMAFPGEPWVLSPYELEHGFSPSQSQNGSYSRRLKQGLAAHPPDPATVEPAGKPGALTFSQRWAGLEAHADSVSRESWSVMKSTASLACKASELDLHRLTSRNFEQLLDAAQRRQRPTSAPLAPGDVFTVQRTPWAVDGIFRHGLNLLVGQPGAGKSRLAAACISAWLRGDQSWLNRDMPCDLPVEQRHALIIGTDQNLEDWALTLEPVGLVSRESSTKVRTHPRLTLHTLETGTALDADGLAVIRRWCDDHPHGVVLTDSLATCLPPGIDEDKSTVARPVHALAEALGNCWGILTHHSRKGAAKEQNLGVGAGRGSSAIDGAVSRVIGLGLIHKMEGGLLLPQESDPRRELLSTKRGGATLHLVIRSDSSGFWSNEGSAADLKAQERKERTIANLTEAQGAVIAALEDSTDWQTGRQVAEALLEQGEEYKARGTHAASTRKILKRLEVLGLVETMRVGLDRLYRVADPLRCNVRASVSQSYADDFEVTCSNGSKTAAQGISPAHPMALTGSHLLSPGPATVEHSEPVTEPAEQAQGEPPVSKCEPPVSKGVSQSKRLRCSVRAIRATKPVNAVVHTGSNGSHRADLLVRLVALGKDQDFSGWSDADLVDMIESLEQAERRRSAALNDLPLRKVA